MARKHDRSPGRVHPSRHPRAEEVATARLPCYRCAAHEFQRRNDTEIVATSRSAMLLHMHTRDATEDDLATIVAIYNQTIPSRMVTADTEPVSVDSWRPWLQLHRDARQPAWVLEHDGVVVGWLAFTQFRPRVGYRPSAELSLYLAAEQRGRGLGTQLLAQAILAAARLGYRNLIGLVFAHNTPSMRLTARAGFQRWGCLPEAVDLDGIARDVLVVGRRV
jgi:phosphinothricin acetyltransferase